MMTMDFDNRLAHESLTTLLARCQPMEARHLLDQLRAGRISGADSRDCLIGYVARFRNQTYATSGLSFGYSWQHPESTHQIERWVKAIRIGDTPQNSAQAQLLEQWLVEWLDAHTLELQSAVVQQVTR